MDKATLNYLNQHSMPVTRRDFLSLGLVGCTSFVMFPFTDFRLPVNGNRFPAFLVIDLAGGAALPGNFLVGYKGGPTDFIKDYSRLGWNPRDNKIDDRFGLPMAGEGTSKILQGILDFTQAKDLKNLKFGTLLHHSKSDSHSNLLNAMGLVSQLSNSKMVSCHQHHRSRLTNCSEVPFRMKNFTSTLKALLKGYSDVGVITVSGCDYHDGTRMRGDLKDYEIGSIIAKAVLLAKKFQRPLFLQIITDGGIASLPGTRTWVTDDDRHSMSVLGYYNPYATPQLRRAQIGYYDMNGKVNSATLVGEPIKAAYAAFANYLQVSGRLGDFERYAPGVFNNKELEEVLIFA